MTTKTSAHEKPSSSKVLCTGGQGFIGSHLEGYVVDIKDGHNVLTCDLPDADVVYHLASQSSVEASWNDPVNDADNLRMIARLVKRYPNSKIIYTNTAANKFSSPYGFSKHVVAEYLQTFHTNYVILTLPNVYGPNSRSVVDIYKNSEGVGVVYGDGLQTRDYVHVEDIARALEKATDWKSGCYELGSGIPTTNLQLLEYAGLEPDFHPARKEARESVLENTTPGWSPLLSVKEYLCS